MKELIRNWLALPGLLWSAFIYLLRALWARRGRTIKNNCSTCKFYIKQSTVSISWSYLLRTKNKLIEEIDKEGLAKTNDVEYGNCSLGRMTDTCSACKSWSNIVTEEERILSHNW